MGAGTIRKVRWKYMIMLCTYNKVIRKKVDRTIWIFILIVLLGQGVLKAWAVGDGALTGVPTSSGMHVQDVKPWHLVRAYPQKSFSSSVPAGNYSGITHLYEDVYAVVSDKSDSALYFNFRIRIDSITGELRHMECLGALENVDGSKVDSNLLFGPTERGFDHEAIAKVSDSTLVVSSEGLFRLKEYLVVPSASGKMNDHLWEFRFPKDDFYFNYGYESLSYDSVRHVLWAMPESVLKKDGEPATPQNGNANQLRLLGFDWSAHAQEHSIVAENFYQMDKPSTRKKAQTYVMGVSEICSLPDGQLLVLEREAFVPKMKLGAFCQCKLYVVNPCQVNMEKVEVTEWRTTMTLFDHSFANYEGMCLGPRLPDGSQVVILLSDSQNQYAGVLKDWFKTIVIRKESKVVEH